MYTIHRIDQNNYWQKFGTAPILIRAPQAMQCTNAVLQGWLKPSLKAGLAIYSHVVDVSVQ